MPSSPKLTTNKVSLPTKVDNSKIKDEEEEFNFNAALTSYLADNNSDDEEKKEENFSEPTAFHFSTPTKSAYHPSEYGSPVAKNLC